MQTIPLAKICPIKTNFEQLISDEPPHSYIRTPYFGIGIMRNLQMAMQLCISILFIDKWLCNFTFRFCSSTNGYATLHFDFVHQQNGYATLHFGFVHQQNGYATLHFGFVHRQNGYATLQFDFVHRQNGYATLHFGFVHRQNG